MKYESMLSDVKIALKVPEESEFLSLCSSFSQYTGNKIKITFLDKAISGNKFILAIYDEYAMHFTNTTEMINCLTGLMYVNLKEKISTPVLSRGIRPDQRDTSNTLSV